jgi:hypothetical protein
MRGTMYRINRNTIPTKEEKVAQKISTLVSDYSLDLEAVGYYMATAIPYLTYSRALEILEAARYNKDVAEYYRQGGYYDDRLL